MLSMMRRLPIDSVYSKMKSPVGNLWIIGSSQGLHAILWDKDLKEDECKNIFSEMKQSKTHPVVKSTLRQLDEYFSGNRNSFELPLVLDGTSFQKKAWKQLTRIPYGKTLSYQQQAEKIGDQRKARAVGSANSRNPISIVVPCHRVVSKNGALNGFAGGQKSKQYLIDLETQFKGTR